MRLRLSILLLLAAAACSRAELDRGARTTLTAGDPHPGAAPPSSRTIDSTGWVDNGGRTSDMWGRSEMSGARGTEAGWDRVTTVTGVPNGADLGGRGAEVPKIPERAEVMPHESGASPVAGYVGAPATIARARCDHELMCARIGDGRTWPSQDACMTDFRARVGAELGTCELDHAAVSTCLRAIRTQACTAELAGPDALSQCLVSALCAP